ncbi:MAG: hypothetical protein LBG65_05535 [Puniceicoccales bacterium]|jgi:hypothetical protein|nr:hypothetical protein [Puniceicoccales bacterium]
MRKRPLFHVIFLGGLALAAGYLHFFRTPEFIPLRRAVSARQKEVRDRCKVLALENRAAEDEFKAVASASNFQKIAREYFGSLGPRHQRFASTLTFQPGAQQTAPALGMDPSPDDILGRAGIPSMSTVAGDDPAFGVHGLAGPSKAIVTPEP